ncbi:MAG: hypothetical protein ACFB21_12465 [Opitutales bacterium]
MSRIAPYTKRRYAYLARLQDPIVHRWILAAAVLVIAALGLFLLAAHFGLATYIWMHLPEPDTFGEWLRTLPTGWVLLLFLLLPLAGLPLSAFLVLIGFRFGWLTGSGIALGVLVLHHLLAYFAMRGSPGAFLRRKVSWAVRDYREVSKFRQARFLATMSIFPGISFVFKLVYGASTGVPLTTYVLASVTAQMCVALPYLILGETFTGGNLVTVTSILAGILILSAVVQKVMKRKGTKAPPIPPDAADGNSRKLPDRAITAQSY